MYLKHTLYCLYKKTRREEMWKIAKEVSALRDRNQLMVCLDMIYCSLRFGCMFTEYNDLDFAFRTNKNRATYVTTFYDFRLYDKINAKDKRKDFRDKNKFLNNFSSLIGREWCDASVASDREVENFVRKHGKVVLKSSCGDSGKQVCVRTFSKDAQAKDLRKILEEGNYDLIEECLTNHPALSVFNPSSLNTIRIVTLNLKDKVSFLFAGLRVGAKGAEIDNISQGGAVARIDLQTGKINSRFYGKKSSASKDALVDVEDRTGEQIPCWEEVKELAAKAAKVIPEMGIVAWDICVTEQGPEIIEGNESFGCVIMQLYYGHNEPGLKPRLLALLREGGIVE